MGYVPSEYDKYFNFGLIDYSEFDINIEPPTPPPIPQNNNNNNQESQGQEDQESIPENIDSSENQIKDQEIMPELNQDESLAVETDSDMNYCFDVVSYSLNPECTNIEEAVNYEDTILEPEQIEDTLSTENESNGEDIEEQESNFDKIPMEVRLSKPCKMIFNRLSKNEMNNIR